jgi:hypothetical protein
VLILGVPILDTVLAIVRRATKRTGVASADKEHIHHRLMRLGHGQRRSVLILWGWTALLSVMVLYPTYTGRGNGLVPIGIAALGLALFTILRPGTRRGIGRRVDGDAEVGVGAVVSAESVDPQRSSGGAATRTGARSGTPRPAAPTADRSAVRVLGSVDGDPLVDEGDEAAASRPVRAPTLASPTAAVPHRRAHHSDRRHTRPRPGAVTPEEALASLDLSGDDPVESPGAAPGAGSADRSGDDPGRGQPGPGEPTGDVPDDTGPATD